MRRKIPIRIVALDLHPRSFGYVVVESPKRLLDWGVSSYRGTHGAGNVLVRKRLRQLLDLWRPAALVLHNPSKKSRRPNPKKDRLLERIVTEAKSRRIIVRPVKSSADQAKILTKYENARRVAEHFPVLTRELPPKRKAWESEHYRMSIFTAAALAMAQLHAKSASTPAMPKRRPPHGTSKQQKKEIAG
jgi:hypothetical protein